MKLNVQYFILLILSIFINNTKAQLKVASCQNANNNFGNIAIALDASGNYVGGSPNTCNIRNVNINNTNDTVIVREGTTTTRSDLNGTINGVVIVYGTLDLETGNQSLTINSNGQLLIYGTISGENNTSIMVNGYMLVADSAQVSTGAGSNADITINGSGIAEINGDLTTPSLTNNGTIVGAGTIFGSITNQGTVNGSNATINTSITPLGLTPQTALTWQSGFQWSNDPPGQGINNKNGLAILMEEDFEVGVNNGDFVRRFSKISVKNNKTLKVNGDFVYTNNLLLDDGRIEFRCSSRIDSKTKLTGNGSSTVSMSKCLNWTGWHYFNFPVKTNSSLTLGDISLTGTPEFVYDPSSNARNIFQWDPTASSWVSVTLSSSTSVGGKTFIYWGTNDGNITLEASPSDFNNAPLNAPIAYHNPGPSSTPPGGSNGWASTVTDGWVMIPNPFQDELDWENVRLELLSNSNFDETAVYVWDGQSETYVTWNGSGSQSRYIPPYTPVFVRVSSSAGGNFQLKNSFRRNNPITSSAPRMANELSSVFLNVEGQGYQVQTEIIENELASNNFDGHFDAHYMLPMSDAPLLFTVTDDSLAVNINQRPNLEDTVVVSFSHPSDGAIYTISSAVVQYTSFVNIMLYDVFADSLIDINQSNYDFVNSVQAPVERFRLVVYKNGLQSEDFHIANESSNPDLRVWFSHDELNVALSNTLHDADLHLVNMAGQTLYSRRYNELTNTSIPMDLPSGVYVVWVYSLEGSQRVKVVKP